MRFVIINTMVQASKRLRSRLVLQPPGEPDTGPRRRDRTGFILLLCAIAVVITVALMA